MNKPFPEITAEDFNDCYQVNVIGVMQTVQAALPKMLDNGGHIVNISSMGGFQGSVKFAGLTAYSTSKAAVASTTNAVESSNKALRKAENAFNKATNGGKDINGSKATAATKRLADARANASGAAAQQVVTKTTNRAVNSTAGKVAGKAAETSIGDKVKSWFGF